MKDTFIIIILLIYLFLVPNSLNIYLSSDNLVVWTIKKLKIPDTPAAKNIFIIIIFLTSLQAKAYRLY